MGMYFTCPVCAEGCFSDRRHVCPGPPEEPLDDNLVKAQRILDDEVARRRAGLPAWSGQSVSPKAASVPPPLDLRALAAELRSALADQRDHGASSYEVAKRVRAVADLLDPSPAQPEQTPQERRQAGGQSLPSDLGRQPEAGSSNP